MGHPIRVEVNGRTYEREVESRLLLVHFLRDELGLTGANVGCETSLCGACTVLVDGAAVKSCTQLAVQADGASITTIEGLAENGELHPLQKAFRDEHALQCGYCTPGMILSAYALLRGEPRPERQAILSGMERNLCRCGAHQRIVAAIEAASRGQGESS